MPQPISPEQWDALKQVALVMKAAQAEESLDDTWNDFTEHLTRLLTASSGSTEGTASPFEVTEHWLYLLSHFINNAPDDPAEIAAGSLHALEWAANTLTAACDFGLKPVQHSTKSIWLIVTGANDDAVQ